MEDDDSEEADDETLEDSTELEASAEDDVDEEALGSEEGSLPPPLPHAVRTRNRPMLAS